MFAKVVQLSLRIVLVGLILEMTGGQYVLLQMVAWSQMIVDYSKTAPIQEALLDTFDGHHPCNLCKSIQKAKQTEKKPDAVQINVKQEFFCQAYGIVIVMPPHHSWRQVVSEVSLSTFSERPPIPPPRSLLG